MCHISLCVCVCVCVCVFNPHHCLSERGDVFSGVVSLQQRHQLSQSGGGRHHVHYGAVRRAAFIIGYRQQILFGDGSGGAYSMGKELCVSFYSPQ